MKLSLSSNYSFKNSFKSNNRLELYLVLAFLAIYTVVNFYFGLNEDATWDDDCPTRYYNTLNAFNNPKIFVSVWNRPLFTLIFAPIVHLGRHSIFVSMVLMTAISGYFLYSGLKKAGAANAFMVLPFLLFQTYFFTISRNAETEPISVSLLCLGVYFLAHKKWLGFAIVGGLMPLARLELSVLLVFWAYYLLKEKQYYYIILLGVPTLLWNIAGGIFTGDYLYVYSKTFGGDNEKNRYGHTTFGHYFQRYIYVLGPVIYTFFILGLVARIKKLKLDAFVFWQMVAGFFLYVIFSWKLNLGNAAGFLRNLVPLTPLVAIFALDGFNYITEALFKLKSKSRKEVEKMALANINLPVRNYTVLSVEEINQLSTKKRRAYYQKVDKYEDEVERLEQEATKKAMSKNKPQYGDLVVLILSLLFIVLTVYVYHSLEIKSHHKLTEVVDYTNLKWAGITLIGIVVLIIYSLLGKPRTAGFASIGGGIAIIALLFTGITEPPNANMSGEREAMQVVSDRYVDSYLSDYLTYANHTWFYWANDLDKYDTLKYKTTTMANLGSAPLDAVCIYETHYSSRLAGDVMPNWFKNNKSWVLLTTVVAKDKTFNCQIYQKTDSTNDAKFMAVNKYLQAFPDDQFAYVSRASLYQATGKLDSALVDYSKAISMDTSFANFYMARGLIYFNQKQYDSAMVDYKIAFKKNPKSHDALHNIGACFANKQMRDSAVYYYDQSIKVNPKFYNAYLNKANTLLAMKQKDEALTAYTQALSINNKNPKVLLSRAQLYYENKQWLECYADLEKALKLQPTNNQAMLIKGICLLQLTDTAAACNDFTKSAQLGNQQAGEFMKKFCTPKIPL